MVKMTNMKRFVVQKPLEVLPQGMEKIKHLTEIDVRHNKLKVFNVDTSQYTFLSRLFLGFNKIKSIHESVFVHQKLTMLWVNSNKDLNFPQKYDCRMFIFWILGTTASIFLVRLDLRHQCCAVCT